MPIWTPKFNLVSVEPFIANLKTVFEARYADALTWASPSGALRPLQAINTARQLAESWPVCNLLPYGGDPAQSEDAARIIEAQRILVEFETAGRDADALAVHLVRYVLAGRSVVYEMSREDWTKDIPAAGRSAFIWSVSTERYGERFYEAENKFTMVGSFVVTLNYTVGRQN